MVEKRLQSLRKLCNLKAEQLLYLNDPEQVRYFSGFIHAEEAALIVGQARAYLVTDSRFTVEAAEVRTSQLEVWTVKSGTIGLLKKLTSKWTKPQLIYNPTTLPVASLERFQKKLSKVQCVPSKHSLELLRSVKDEAELQSMRKAAKLLDACFLHIYEVLRPGLREQEVAWEIEKFLREHGAEQLAFPVIVASGPQTALPHAIPGERRLESGDLVLLDIGAVVEGYCSDATRTVVLGEGSSEQKKLYQAVYEAYQKAAEKLRVGSYAREADAAARAVLQKHGLDTYFTHSLGHGVGLAVHERPYLSSRSRDRLAENMVVTCEPGVYQVGIGGIRIEDTFRITGGVAEPLTQPASSTLLVVSY